MQRTTKQVLSLLFICFLLVLFYVCLFALLLGDYLVFCFVCLFVCCCCCCCFWGADAQITNLKMHTGVNMFCVASEMPEILLVRPKAGGVTVT